MRPIAFVSDLGVHPHRAPYRAALRAIADPVLAHLPEGVFSETPVAGALNVRFFVITLDRKADVFVSHGIADKAYRNYESVREFPFIFVSGPRWVERYIEQGCPPGRLRMAGYPKLDPIFNGEIKRGDGPRILWAPTHPTSWPLHYGVVKRTIRALPFEVGESQHPQLTATPTLQPLADADVVIADGGSTIYEAWALGKPVVFPSWLVRRSRMIRRGTLEQEIYERGIGYHADSLTHLVEQIRRAQEHGITDAERDFIAGILPPDLRGTSGQAHATALRQIAEES